jgi:hypothetical protein
MGEPTSLSGRRLLTCAPTVFDTAWFAAPPQRREVFALVKQSMWRAIATDVQLWAPVIVLVFGLVLLAFMR